MVLIVRYGEISVKGPATRSRMEKLLERNIRCALSRRGLRGKTWRESGRIYVSLEPGEEEEAAEAVSKVFGVVSVSPAVTVEFQGLGELAEKTVELFADTVKGRVFRVRARRVGDHPFTSKDAERVIGAALNEYASGVDLENPEVTIYAEIRGWKAYLYTSVMKGPGGLPLGSEDLLVSLFSGGIDSPVATWRMMKRGARVEPVFFLLAGGQEKAVLEVARKLYFEWGCGYDASLHVVDYRPVRDAITRLKNKRVWNTLLRRFMLRGAEIIAEELGAKGLVTGESLGQVSSQTLQNMLVAEHPVRLPIYRPLIGMDKDEIVAEARRIGTYELSSRLCEACVILSRRPTTRARLEDVNRAEEEVGLELVERLVEGRSVIRLTPGPRGASEPPEPGFSCP